MPKLETSPELEDENEAESAEEKSSEEEAFARNLLAQVKEREGYFDKHWWKDGEKAVEIYDGGKVDEIPYNILYSNTEVLLPSIFSATPKPDTRPRFRGADIKPIPEVIDRFLTVAVDQADGDTEDFFDVVSDATLSSLTAGAGIVRLRHREEAAFPLSFESVYYRNFLWAKGRKWQKLPWIAFKHEMTKESFAKQFGIDDEDLAENYAPPEEVETDDDAKTSDCCVYEVWYKPERQVYFLCDRWKSVIARKDEDPLRLSGFYPTLKPLVFTKKPGNLLPTPLYKYYQNQAEELNRVTARLNGVLRAIRVRGVYNDLLGEELKKLLENDLDNSMLKADNAAALMQLGGFEKNIWFLPIDQLIKVAMELYKSREAIKQVIYELTGISDIIRGSSVASETATAQDLKNKWGTVRLRKMQTLVANYTRDLFRLAVDAGVQVIPAAQWKTITQLPIPLQEEKMVAQQQMQYQQMIAQQTGQPVQPDPQMQMVLSSPSMEEVLARIISDQNRAFTVNIQNSSTIDLDTAPDKAEVTEFMNALGQLMSGVQAFAALGPGGFEAAKQILVSTSQRFKFGQEISEKLSQLQMPQPQPEGQEQGPSPEEQQAAQAEAQMKMQQIQLDSQIMQARAALEMQKLQFEREKLEMEREKLMLDMQRARMEAAAAAAKSKETRNAPVRNRM